jgi:adenylate kinase family enzyme
MLKVHILGGPGSGKTTFAQELSSLCKIPHHDLDRLMWKNGTNGAAYLADVASIVEQPGWVAEGIFLLWTGPLLQQADAIVLLEISWPVAAWRILLRHASKTLHRTNPYPSKLLYNFLKDTRRYYLNEERSVSSTDLMHVYLERYKELADLPEAESLLSYVDEYGEICIPPTAEFVSRYLEKYKEKLFVVKNQSERERVLELLTKK